MGHCHLLAQAPAFMAHHSNGDEGYLSAENAAISQADAAVSGKVAVDHGQELVNIERFPESLRGSVGQQLIDDPA
jgi:hypothetical protein